MQTEPTQLLAFELDGERYCTALEGVAEVVENEELSPLPNAPAAVVGVTDLRGETMRVLDPRVPLGGSGGPGGDRIVVTRPGGGPPVGWLVDDVDDVLAADEVDLAAGGDDGDGGGDDGAGDAGGVEQVDFAALAADTPGAVAEGAAPRPTQLLELRVGDSRFAVALDDVAEIESAAGLTDGDDVPPDAAGVLPLAVETAVAYDPGAVYDVGDESSGARAVVLHAETDDGRPVAWLVDEVDDVFRPDVESVEPSGVDGVRGVVHEGERFVMWLDPRAAT